MFKFLNAIKECLLATSCDEDDIVFIDYTSLIYCHHFLKSETHKDEVHICGDKEIVDALVKDFPINVHEDSKGVFQLTIVNGEFIGYTIHVHPWGLVPVDDELAKYGDFYFSSLSYEVSRQVYKANSLIKEDLELVTALIDSYWNDVCYECCLQFLHIFLYNVQSFKVMDKKYKQMLQHILKTEDIDCPNWSFV